MDTALVALTSLAKVFLLLRMFDHKHSLPVLFVFRGDKLEHTYSTLHARIGPQWLSELRRLAEFSLTSCV